MAIAQRNALDRQEWLSLAACRGPDASAFYPPPQFEPKPIRLRRERLAKSICVDCPVRGECLEFAVETGESHGVWGGLNEVERRALRSA